jgi:uncharacterized membrane protein
LDKDGALAVRGLVVAWRDREGRTRIEHAISLAEAGAHQRGLTGLIGLLVFAPLLGAAIGSAGGAAAAKLIEFGLDVVAARDVRQTLEPGEAALFVLGSPEHLDQIADALGRLGPRVLKTSLPAWEGKYLTQALIDAADPKRFADRIGRLTHP